jgi:hypothetical protein
VSGASSVVKTMVTGPCSRRSASSGPARRHRTADEILGNLTQYCQRVLTQHPGLEEWGLCQLAQIPNGAMRTGESRSPRLGRS